MSLTSEQNDRLAFMLQEIEPSTKDLNDWEKGFIADQIKRYDEYKGDIRLSPKQWDKIEQIYEKVTGVPRDGTEPSKDIDDEIPY